MKINEIIRTRRKELKLTQEQAAEYLGISAPAVNKWEKGVSYPDITLLPPLARLLKVDLNTLLSFKEELTDEEINHFCSRIFAVLKESGYKPGHELAVQKIKEYPNSYKLIYNLAGFLKGALLMF
ncbi:helix-turn-helix domain-containing protein, partial [Blautia pseudococcoides]|nr:helix-turn-helix domain-containing protein [Blautia pseudococcoides]